MYGRSVPNYNLFPESRSTAKNHEPILYDGEAAVTPGATAEGGGEGGLCEASTRRTDGFDVDPEGSMSKGRRTLTINRQARRGWLQ